MVLEPDKIEAKTSPRMTASDFPQELLDLYDFYAHGMMTRREFIDKASKFAVGGVTATMLLQQLSPNYALAQQVAPNDPAIKTERITYPSPNGHGEVNGYMVLPAGSADQVLPAVLVIHENRGLNPYIEDVARRMGKAGFLALAPDGLTSQGGYPGNDDEGRELQRKVDREKLLNDFFAAFEYLLDHDKSTGKVGAVGFCYGGGVVNALAVAYPELGAGVSFYGRQPPTEDVHKIEAPLLIQLAEHDDRINAGWTAYEQELQSTGKNFLGLIYPDTNHGFHNDTTPRFNEEAARLAEKRTIDFFKRYLENEG